MDTKKQKKKKINVNTETLIIVNVQNDFINEDGAYPVENSGNISKSIINYIEKHKDSINQIIFVRDWRLKKDLIFDKNGGDFPVHCVQKTEGAALNKELYEYAIKSKIQTNVVDKGTVFNHNERGAFEHCGTFHHLYPNDTPIVQHCYFANSESTSGSRIINNDVTICGISVNNSIEETIKNMKKHWRQFNVKVFMDGTVMNDDLAGFIDENNIKTI